jgi:cellulose synthase/poly-beta-1,6-N-acetylglucosamine synthase-like glycosyltransferase
MLVRRQARAAAAWALGEARSANRTALRQSPAGILARLRRARQRRLLPAAAPLTDDDYGFLLGRLIDGATLRRAGFLATRWGVSTHEVLISTGWVLDADYVSALAAHVMLPAVEGRPLGELSPSASYPPWPSVVAGILDGRDVVAVEARSFAPNILRSIAAAGSGRRKRFVLATRAEIARAVDRQRAPALMDLAVNGLWRRSEDLSARMPHALWQTLFVVSLVGLMIGSVVAAADVALPAIAALLALPFLCVVLVRCCAVAELLRPPARPRVQALANLGDDASLPVYSVLVALYREADVLPGLVRALAALDYPAAKLQVLLALEKDDHETLRVAEALDLPGNFEIVRVPDRGPRTKPKTLNYALGLARGEFVVVYDAEDLPQPDQVRRALAIFSAAGPEVACVQAQLDIHNAHTNWLTRQFTLEYAALFAAILPALERLNIPVPLGGTSNHFRAGTLRRIGAWDPYNVTEDADLGFRIAREGFVTTTLQSSTWEEAPQQLGNWFRQRTRWIKGWMQTFLVHNRAPRRILRDLGWKRWIGLNVLMGSILLSILVHPWCYLLLIVEGASGRLFVEATGHVQRWLWWIAVLNLGLGYASAMMLGALAAIRIGRPELAKQALLTPIYWLLISCAGYRALIQLVRSPYLWEKTQHGAGAAAHVSPGVAASAVAAGPRMRQMQSGAQILGAFHCVGIVRNGQASDPEPSEGQWRMSVDLSGSHSSIDVNDKMKTYNLFHKLMRATIVLVILILIFMAWYLV